MIEKSLKENQNHDDIKIFLPVNELNKVGGVINAKYDAEIIDDNLFIKFDAKNPPLNSKFV
ncbi:26468_t:CDS:2 [Dentiscutata erythropus]|uniref:26468_t:CDS:1 n=1 Tax=Dentiscutata erythropus TaxID=1348616 RepID=A0A9N9GPQ0_9GLOM|nr:26468_t:CDS:2 [Dentiscutata erythropus]